MTVPTTKFAMGFNSLFKISFMFFAVWSYWTSDADAVRRNLGNKNDVGRKNTSFTNSLTEEFVIRRVPQLKRKRRSMRSLTWSFYTHINHEFHYQVLKESDLFLLVYTGSDGFIFQPSKEISTPSHFMKPLQICQKNMSPP